MKIGVLSDIHGNSYALESVLNECKNEGVNKLLILGDIVGYYYHPDIVLKMLSEWDYEMIKGNHEVILKNLKEHKVNAEILKAKYGSGHNLALKKINEEQLKCLFSLPEQKTVEINNVSFQLNHGSPWSLDEYIYPDTSLEKLNQCNSDQHDFVLIGHSHYAFTFDCEHSVLINCGSVGQSRKKGGVANWALIDLSNKNFKIKETLYDISKLILEVMELDPENSYMRTVLER